MSGPRGSEAEFALFTESVFGTDPGAPDGVKLHLVECNLSESQELIEDETLTGGRGVAKPMLGDITNDGSLVGNLNGTSHAFLLFHLLGGVDTTGADPYTHVFTGAALPAGAMIEIDNGPKITGASRYAKNNGRRFTSAEFNFTDKGPCRFTINTVGKKVNKSATPLDATLTDYGHQAFTMFSANLLEGGAAFASAKTITMRVESEVEADETRVVGGQGQIQDAPEGRMVVTGTITGVYNDESQAVIDKGFAGTESSLQITLSHGDGLGSAGNESVEFLVQQLIFGPVVPGVSGPAGREFSVEFSAFLDGTDLGLQVTVKNAIATIA